MVTLLHSYIVTLLHGCMGFPSPAPRPLCRFVENGRDSTKCFDKVGDKVRKSRLLGQALFSRAKEFFGLIGIDPIRAGGACDITPRPRSLVGILQNAVRPGELD